MNAFRVAIIGLAIMVVGLIGLVFVGTTVPAYVDIPGGVMLVGFATFAVSMLSELWRMTK